MWQTIIEQAITRVIIPSLLRLINPEMFNRVLSEIGWAGARATKFTQIDDNIMREVDKSLGIERK